jgi:hypothetical protein
MNIRRSVSVLSALRSAEGKALVATQRQGVHPDHHQHVFPVSPHTYQAYITVPLLISRLS